MIIDISHYKGKIMQHFKGNYYLVEEIGVHCDTGEQFVIYRGLYDDNRVYVRPITDFVSKVDKNKYPNCPQEYKFVLVKLANNAINYDVPKIETEIVSTE